MTPKEKEELIRKALESMAGRNQLKVPNPFAGLMPQRPSAIDVAKAAFPIQQLPPGAFPIYDNSRCERCDGYYKSLESHTSDQCDLKMAVDVMES